MPLLPRLPPTPPPPPPRARAAPPAPRRARPTRPCRLRRLRSRAATRPTRRSIARSSARWASNRPSFAFGRIKKRRGPPRRFLFYTMRSTADTTPLQRAIALLASPAPLLLIGIFSLLLAVALQASVFGLALLC